MENQISDVWEIEEIFDPENQVTGPLVILNQHGQVVGQTGGYREYSEEVRNARWMAAAAEMVEALQNLLHKSLSEVPRDAWYAYAEEWRIADAVLAKATGRPTGLTTADKIEVINIQIAWKKQNNPALPPS